MVYAQQHYLVRNGASTVTCKVTVNHARQWIPLRVKASQLAHRTYLYLPQMRRNCRTLDKAYLHGSPDYH